MSKTLPSAALNATEQIITHVLRTARMSYLESWNMVVQSLQDTPSLVRSGSIQQRNSRPGSIQYVFCLFFTHIRIFVEQIRMMEEIHRTHPIQRFMNLSSSLHEDVARCVQLNLLQNCATFVWNCSCQTIR